MARYGRANLGRRKGIVTPKLERVVAEFRNDIQKDEPGLAVKSTRFQAALVSLTAMEVGTNNLRLLSRATGVSYPLVLRFARNLREADIWASDGRIVVEWNPNDEKEASIGFWLDVLIAVGEVKKVGDGP